VLGVLSGSGGFVEFAFAMSLTRLSAEQEELLAVLVESFRSVPRNERHAALIADGFGLGNTVLVHNGLAAIGKESYRLYLGDAKELAIRGLIRLELVSQSAYQADITNDGFTYYARMKVAGTQPIARIETAIRSYLFSDSFAQRHPGSFAKWRKAEEALKPFRTSQLSRWAPTPTRLNPKSKRP
jgi:hypothetical protein